MKKILKRSTAILLALIMIVSTIALTVVAQGTVDGFGQDNGNWYYYQNSQVDTSRNDVIKGTVNGQDGWWYVVGGQVQLNYTGVANYANSYGWWYIENGKVNFSKTGIEPNDYGWWRVVNGKVDFSCNSVEQNDYGWWYVVGGQVQFDYTGVANYGNDYGWWYVKNGKVDFGCNSVEQNSYGWWYVIGGQVQFGYTGVANYSNAYGWWYIRNGQVDFGKTGIEPNDYGWWRVVNGKVDFSCNSVEQNDYGWWYVVGGQVQFGYTGVVNYTNEYGWWYVENGKVNFNFTGTASNSYGKWYVENGKVDFRRDVADPVMSTGGTDTDKSGHDVGTDDTETDVKDLPPNENKSESSGNEGSDMPPMRDESCSHVWDDGVVTEAATCTTAGVRTYTCTKCGATKTESIAALGHDWDENKQTVHYDEVGYWSIETIYEYRIICNTCGWYREDTTGMTSSQQGSDVSGHQITEHGSRGSTSTYSVDIGATGEWIVDSSAYDEIVTDWSTTYCARCGQKYDHEHEYGDPTFIWSEDGTELKAQFVCSIGDDVQIVDGVVTSYEPYAIWEDQPREATSTRDGQYISIGYVVFNGKTYYDSCESIIPAYGS